MENVSLDCPAASECPESVEGGSRGITGSLQTASLKVDLRHSQPSLGLGRQELFVPLDGAAEFGQ